VKALATVLLVVGTGALSLARPSAFSVADAGKEKLLYLGDNLTSARSNFEGCTFRNRKLSELFGKNYLRNRVAVLLELTRVDKKVTEIKVQSNDDGSDQLVDVVTIGTGDPDFQMVVDRLQLDTRV
jgi:hypothetical protein